MNALRRAPRPQPARAEAEQIVYRGREAVGAISPRDGKWRALDMDGRAIGRFVSRLEAFAAVLRRAGAP
jgi:hypothetical protein